MNFEILGMVLSVVVMVQVTYVAAALTMNSRQTYSLTGQPVSSRHRTLVNILDFAIAVLWVLLIRNLPFGWAI